MIKIESDKITVSDHLGNQVIIDANDSPDDSIPVLLTFQGGVSFRVEISRQELVNYLNTGFFKQEV